VSDNILILGAGFSRRAGIPLLSDFAQTMWDLAARKSYQGNQLSPADCGIFEKAEAIRTKLDRYHGRANFNERNIEDILSILTFDVLAEEPGAKEHLADLNSAIARTIELTCTVKHPGIPQKGGHTDVSKKADPVYLNFWRGLVRLRSKNIQFPTILTFNYDLVLERLLFISLIGGSFPGFRKFFPENHLRLRYYFEHLQDRLFTVENVDFTYGPSFERRSGIVLNNAEVDASDSEFAIEYLKLHGSLNFPANATATASKYDLTVPLSQPSILPPVFNKLSGSAYNNIWKIALQRLRNARNVVIVGYSLPRTDIYMQYFLKAGLGPNLRFDRLTVFDPALFRTDQADAMRQRYADCFSPQQQERIVYNPTSSTLDNDVRGTAVDFIETLNSNPDRIFF
jgi:hypothetical protein